MGYDRSITIVVPMLMIDLALSRDIFEHRKGTGMGIGKGYELLVLQSKRVRIGTFRKGFHHRTQFLSPSLFLRATDGVGLHVIDNLSILVGP